MKKNRFVKSLCSGVGLKLQYNLGYLTERSTNSSRKAHFHRCRLEGVYWCQGKPFWTGLRTKHDIIQGAWDRLCRRKAYAI
jgi:hypothetical protein